MNHSLLKKKCSGFHDSFGRGIINKELWFIFIVQGLLTEDPLSAVDFDETKLSFGGVLENFA